MNRINILLVENERDWIYLIENALITEEGMNVVAIVSSEKQADKLAELFDEFDVVVFDENLLSDSDDEKSKKNIIYMISQDKCIPIVLLVNDIKYYNDKELEGVIYLPKDKLGDLQKSVKYLYSIKDSLKFDSFDDIDNMEIQKRVREINGERPIKSIFSRIKDLF